VSNYATLSQVTLGVLDPSVPGAGVVQQKDKMLLQFFMPVPLNAGCKVTVVLPRQYSVSTINQIYTLQAFGAYTPRSIS
jgi:hypothetical protein